MLETVLGYVGNEFKQAMKAPGAFVATLMLAFALSFGLARMIYAERNDVLKERMDGWKERYELLQRSGSVRMGGGAGLVRDVADATIILSGTEVVVPDLFPGNSVIFGVSVTVTKTIEGVKAVTIGVPGAESVFGTLPSLKAGSSSFIRPDGASSPVSFAKSANLIVAAVDGELKAGELKVSIVYETVKDSAP